MNLQTFNPENLPSVKGSTKQPLIGLSSKTGTFRINRTASEKMGLKKNYCVLIHQNTDEISEWFLEVVKEGGFELREKESVTPGGLLFQSAPLARKIFESVNYSNISGHLQVGPQPVKNGKQLLWPLFTGKLL